jgi:SAM-dependent methyltransferase
VNYKLHTRCRVCDSEHLIKYIDLGELPLSNNLCNSQAEDAERYPLEVLLCTNCGLSQLSIVVDPQVLFGHYVYRSSISQGYLDHCRQMAKDLRKRYNLSSNSFMIDIAGNDGALLSEFRDEIGLEVLNVDPAANLTKIAVSNGICSHTGFWGESTAQSVVSTIDKADLITATNVIAHVDDLYDFLRGIKLALSDSGVFVVEFPYLLDFIKKGEFDTIYFEHLSYFSLRPLKIACEKVGLSVSLVEPVDIHGGSVRVHITHNRVENFIICENKLKINDYLQFADDALLAVSEFAVNLRVLQAHDKKIAGFAASAKGNTLLNCAKIGTDLMSYIVDETPEKIGKFSPGTKIPIVSLKVLEQHPPDYLVILSWNFADEIMSKCTDLGYTGDFIIPIPNFQFIENADRAKSRNCA